MRTDEFIISIAIAVVLPAVSFSQTTNIINSLLRCPNVSRKECASNKNCGNGEKCRETKCIDACSEEKCGDNEGCQIIRPHVSSCECLPEFERNHKGKCVPRRTCILNKDCDVTEECIDDECINVCLDFDCHENEGCQINHHNGSCECLSGFLRNAAGKCVSNKTCLTNENCRPTETCRTGDCVCACYKKSCSDPNEGCQVNRNHSSSCECLPGYVRNTNGIGCKLQCIENKDCGHHQVCKIIKHVSTCLCESGYTPTDDSPNHCYKDCVDANECDNSEVCSNFHCINSCIGRPCTDNTACSAIDHRSICQCLPNYTGDGYDKCFALCSDETVCQSTERCNDGKCIDACEDFSCPDHFHCVASDHKTKCVCNNGYILHTGNCLKTCTKDNECKNEEKCEDKKCINACELLPACPINSTCVASEHSKTCPCNNGFYDDGSKCLKECREEDCELEENCLDHKCVNVCVDNPCDYEPYSHCVGLAHKYVCLCDDGSESGCERSCKEHDDCQDSDRCKDTKCVYACQDDPCDDDVDSCDASNHKCECNAGYSRDSDNKCV